MPFSGLYFLFEVNGNWMNNKIILDKIRIKGRAVRGLSLTTNGMKSKKPVFTNLKLYFV